MAHSRQFNYMLATTVAHVKALHATLSAVMVEVAALRQTVLTQRHALIRYKSKLRKGTMTAKPFVQTAMRSYEAMIHRIERIPEDPTEDRLELPGGATRVQ